MSALTSTEKKSKYDAQCRFIIAWRIVLAFIFQRCMNEFAKQDIHDVMNCIENNPLISQVDADTGELIKGRTNDIPLPNKGRNTMDIVTEVHVPSSDGTKAEKRIVDIELQNDFYPGYPIENREEYYGSILIMAQKDREFKGMDYASIKKVYTIWIQTAPPKHYTNTIYKREMTVKKVQGQKDKEEGQEGLITVVEMNLGKPEECTGVLRLLAVLLSNDLKAEEKRRILEEEFEFDFSEEEKEEVNKMCNLSDAVERKGEERGITRILLLLLKDRLKELSEEVVKAVKQSSVEKLEELALKVYSVTNETEVLHILNA